jgi:uncharacterized membrane-anchored protein
MKTFWYKWHREKYKKIVNILTWSIILWAVVYSLFVILLSSKINSDIFAIVMIVFTMVIGLLMGSMFTIRCVDEYEKKLANKENVNARANI